MSVKVKRSEPVGTEMGNGCEGRTWSRDGSGRQEQDDEEVRAEPQRAMREPRREGKREGIVRFGSTFDSSLPPRTQEHGRSGEMQGARPGR